MGNWWDSWGDALGTFVEDVKQKYEEIDRGLGGWLPGGYEAPQPPTPEPPQQEAFPGQFGLQEAWRGAYETPTAPWQAVPEEEPSNFQYAGPQDIPQGAGEAAGWVGRNVKDYVMRGHLTAPIRDVPVLGGVARAPELVLNTLGQISGRTWQPFYGGMMYNRPEEVAWRNEQARTQGLPGNEQPIANDLWGAERLRRGWEALTGTPAQQEAGRQQFGRLSTPAQLVGVLSDPTNAIALPGALRPTTWKKATMAARAVKPMEEMTGLERFLGGVTKTAGKTEAEIAAMAPNEFRAENLLARTAEKVPFVGKPLSGFAKLTPKSKLAEDVSTVTDQVLPRLGNIIREGGPDIEKVDLGRIVQAVTDIKMPSPEAAAAMGKSARSVNARITQSYLQGFDPTILEQNWQKGQEAIAKVAELKTAIQEGKVAATDVAEVLAKAEKLAAEAPKNKGEALAQFGRDLVEHVSAKGKELYGVPKADQDIDRLINIQKNILAGGLLAANPNYPVTNVMNNLTMALVSGYNPFRRSGTSEAVMREAGLLIPGSKKVGQMAPSRATAAMGMGDVDVSGNRIKTFMNVAQAMEKVQGEGIWTQAFQKYVRQAKDLVLPQDVLGPQVRQALASVDPRLPKWVENAIRNGGDTPADVIKKIHQLPGFSATAALPEITNLLPDSVLADPEMLAMFKTTVTPWLEARLKGLKDPADVQRVVAEAKTMLGDWTKRLDDMGRGRGDILQFLDDFAAKRNATFEVTRQMRDRGGLSAAEDIALVWEDTWKALSDMRAELVVKLKGVVPDKKLEAMDRTFNAWQEEAQRTATRADEARKVAGNDTALLDKLMAGIYKPYTEEVMKPKLSAANKQVKGLLGELFAHEALPAEKKGLWDKYWTKAFNPVPEEEGMIAAYHSKLEGVTDPLTRQKMTAEFHAARQARWEAANEELADMRQGLFGDVKAQATTPPGAAVENPYILKARLEAETLSEGLDEMLAKVQETYGQPVQGGVSGLLRKQVVETVQGLGRDFTDARLAAVQKANVDRDFTMLNYSHRYGFDHYLSIVMPFAFWQNATMKNMAVRFAEQPGLFFAYSRYKQMLNDSEQAPGFPARLRGMIRTHLPFVPDWMGDQFVDVFGKALPFSQMMYPLQAAQWQGEDQSSLMGLLGSPSPLLTIPYNLASGNAKEVGTVLPLTRQVKAATALYKEAGLPGAKKIRPGGENLEGAIRGGLQGAIPGLPMVDQWEDYRIRRMLDDMARMGEITADEAIAAMRAKSGPTYDRAVQKVGVESGIGQLPGLGGALTLKTYPKGEELTKADAAQLNDLAMREAAKALGRTPKDLSEAWDTISARGLAKKGSAISEWYKANPTYSVRSLATTPEKELPGAFAQNAIWKGLQDIPTKFREEMSEPDQDLLQRWYTLKDPTKFTPQELAQLEKIAGDLQVKSRTPEGERLLVLGKERQAIIEREFAKYNGPEGVGDKRAWLKANNYIGKGSPITAWEKANEDYFAETPQGIAWDVLSSVPSAYKKQWTPIQKALSDKFFAVKGDLSKMTPAEQKRLQDLVDDMTILSGTKAYKDQRAMQTELGQLIHKVFTEHGGPEGVDEMTWIKEQGLNKRGSELFQWYQDHPGYGVVGGAAGGTTGGTSTYKPAASTYKSYGGGGYRPYAPAATAANPWTQFKRAAPHLVKATSSYFKKGGRPNPMLIQALYEVYQKLGLKIEFADWLRQLMQNSGLVEYK